MTWKETEEMARRKHFTEEQIEKAESIAFALLRSMRDAGHDARVSALATKFLAAAGTCDPARVELEMVKN